MKSEYREKFFNNYNNKVLPQMKELEQTRHDMKKGFYPEKTYSQLAKEFSLIAKEKCMKDLVSCFDFITGYGNVKNEALVTADEVFDMPYFMNCNTDDSLSGIYKDIPFYIVENYVPKDIFTRSQSTLTNNIFINIKNNKKSKCKILVLNKKHNINWIGVILSGILSIIYIVLKFDMNNVINVIVALLIGGLIIAYGVMGLADWVKSNKIKLEDTKFTEEYDVVADDEIEARYMLTTAFIERLNNLKTVFEGKISCCFHDDNVSFLINTDRDAFEIADIDVKTTDMSLPNKFFDEMMAICEMIDYFKLNERTGL